jgi:hypothetical protein
MADSFNNDDGLQSRPLVLLIKTTESPGGVTKRPRR